MHAGVCNPRNRQVQTVEHPISILPVSASFLQGALAMQIHATPAPSLYTNQKTNKLITSNFKLFAYGVHELYLNIAKLSNFTLNYI